VPAGPGSIPGLGFGSFKSAIINFSLMAGSVTIARVFAFPGAYRRGR
jgi:hypothetical protein